LRTSVDGSVCSDNNSYFQRESNSNKSGSKTSLGKRKRRIKGKEKEFDPIILKNLRRRNNGKENEMDPQNSEPFIKEMGKVVDLKNDFKDNVDYFGSSSSSTSVSSTSFSTAFNSEEYDNNCKEDYYGSSSSSSSSSSPSSESTFTSTSLTFNSYEEYYNYNILMYNIQLRNINNLLNYIIFNDCDLIYIINNIQPYYLLQLIDATNEAEIIPEIFDRIEPMCLNNIIINLNDESRVLLKVCLNFYNEVEQIIKDQFEV